MSLTALPLNTIVLTSGRTLLRVAVGASERVHLVPAVPAGTGRSAAALPRRAPRGTSSLMWLHALGREEFYSWFDGDMLRAQQEWARAEHSAAADAAAEVTVVRYASYGTDAVEADVWLATTLCGSRWSGMLTGADEAARLSRLASSRSGHARAGLGMCGVCWPTAGGAEPQDRAERAARRVLAVR